MFDSLGAALFLYLNIGVPLAACIHVYNKGTLAALKINMKSDMQKVETLLPADFQFKFSALPGKNGPLAKYTNFRQFSEIFR